MVASGDGVTAQSLADLPDTFLLEYGKADGDQSAGKPVTAYITADFQPTLGDTDFVYLGGDFTGYARTGKVGLEHEGLVIDFVDVGNHDPSESAHGDMQASAGLKRLSGRRQFDLLYTQEIVPDDGEIRQHRSEFLSRGIDDGRFIE